MKPLKQFTPVLPLLLLACSFPASGQLVDIGPCRAIEDRLERFDCYEGLGTMEQETDTAPATEVSDAAPPLPVLPTTPGAQPAIDARTPSPQQAAVQEVPEVQEARSENRGTASDADRDNEKEVTETIAELEQITPTLWMITLSNGQKWRQWTNSPYNLQEGDEVRIYSTFWGSSKRLTVERLGGFIQVRRVE